MVGSHITDGTAEVEGASPGEQLLDACRRDNSDLLGSVFEGLSGDPHKIALLINTARDPLGNAALHLCCQYGSWRVLDTILDQEGGIEVDPQTAIDGDTPLHVTVRYCQEEPEHGIFIAKNLIEVGADPRIKNYHNETPLDLVHGEGMDELIDLLQGAELAADNNENASDEEEDEVVDDDGDDDDDDDIVSK